MRVQRFLFGAFVLDPARGTLARDGAPVAIGHRALALLEALVRADGKVLTKSELIDAAWPGAVVEESNLSVQIAALRKMLGNSGVEGESIATVARVGYRLCLPVEVESTSGDDRRPPNAAADSRPSIAVLPLVNLSGQPDQDYFADGVTEDIIMGLSRFRWFRVVGRGSSFAFKHRCVSTREVASKLAVGYVLEGSVRKSAGQVRVALQLMEAAGNQLWGEHYDFAERDIFAMQDSIAEQVAGAIEPELLKMASTEAAAAQPAADASVQDLVHRGVWLFHRVDRASHLQARELFRQACRLAPALGQAQFWLARVNAGIVAYGWSDSEPADLREATGAAIQAIRADEKSPYAHYALAITSVFASSFDQAIRAAQRSIELAPGFALGHLVLGMARLYSGDAAGAIGPLSHGLQLNRFDPQNFVWYHTLAYAHLFAGDTANALAASRRAQEIRPDWAPALESALCALKAHGDGAGARDCALQLSMLSGSTGKLLSPLRQNNPAWDEAIAKWLALSAEEKQPLKS